VCPLTGVKDAQKKALIQRAAAYLCTAAESLEPARIDVLQAPKVIKRPHTIKAQHGDEREDPFYWLRDDAREDQDVIEHLKV
jgi:oligopeptidase B